MLIRSGFFYALSARRRGRSEQMDFGALSVKLH